MAFRLCDSSYEFLNEPSDYTPSCTVCNAHRTNKLFMIVMCVLMVLYCFSPMCLPLWTWSSFLTFASCGQIEQGYLIPWWIAFSCRCRPPGEWNSLVQMLHVHMYECLTLPNHHDSCWCEL